MRLFLTISENYTSLNMTVKAGIFSVLPQSRGSLLLFRSSGCSRPWSQRCRAVTGAKFKWNSLT